MTKATTLDNVALAKQVGVSIGACNELENKAAALREAANKNIAALHNAKAKVGTYRKDGTGCALATAFVRKGTQNRGCPARPRVFPRLLPASGTLLLSTVRPCGIVFLELGM